MPNLGQVLGFDVVREIHPKVKVVSVPTENGLPLEQSFFVLTPNDGALGLPAGPPGDRGPQGDAAFAWNLQPEILPGRSSLPDWLTNAPTDRGKAWFVTDGGDYELAYWTGVTWNFYPGVVIPGPVGPPPTLDGVTVEMLAEDAEPVGVVTGEDGTFAVHLGIPVEPGPEGPQGETVINSSSFVEPPSDGDLLGWDADEQKLKPVIPGRMMGPFTIPPSGFTSVAIPSNQANTRAELCQMQLPALPFDYYTDITGHVEVNCGSRIRVDVEVRLGSADTVGTLLAYGGGVRGNNWDPVRFSTSYAEPVNPMSGNSHGVIPADTSGPSTTLHVVAFNVDTTNQAWQVRPDRAQLAVRIIPVPS